MLAAVPDTAVRRLDQRQAFRPDIQGLRAVAVVLVMLNHAGVGVVPGGYVGVDVFFVISGFLITGLLLADARKGSVRFGTFYARRARRILPAASLVIVVTCLISVHVMNFVAARKVLTDAVWASLFGANFRFSHDGTNYFNHDAASPLQHYWSLAVEEQFYLVWPVVIAVMLLLISAFVGRIEATRSGRSRRPGHRASSQSGVAGWIAVPLVVIAAVSLYLSVTQTTSTSTVPYFSTLDRAWELAAGALLALSLPLVERSPLWVRGLSTWGGAAAIVVAASVYGDGTPFPGIAALLPVLGACALIAGGVGRPTRGFNRLLTTRPFRFVGDISYSLYLWHWPALILGEAWAGHTLSIWHNLLLLVAAFVVSVLSYRLIEDPIRKSRRLWGRRPLRALVMWPAAAVIIVVVTVVVRPAGLTATNDYSSSAAFTQLSVPDQVKQSVLAAQRGAPVPSDLDPAPQDIAADFKSIGDCSGYGKTSNKICQYGDPSGAKNAVLFGSSHSTMWVPALSTVMKDKHWQLFPVVKEACDYTTFLAGSGQCADWYTWALQQIAQLHPDLIIMGGDYSGVGWQADVARAVSAMKGRAPRVEFLQLAPGLSQDPAQCLLKDGATLGSCLTTERPAVLTAAKQEASIVKAAGADYLPTQPWFCSGNLCPSVIGSIVAYADVGHVTQAYADHLVPALAAELPLP